MIGDRLIVSMCNRHQCCDCNVMLCTWYSLVRHVLPGTSPSVTLVPYPSCPSFPQNMLILHGYCIPVNCMGTCVRSKQVICQGSIRRVCKCSMLNVICCFSNKLKLTGKLCEGGLLHGKTGNPCYVYEGGDY